MIVVRAHWLVDRLINVFSTFSYHPPKSTDAEFERVEVRKMINPSRPVNNRMLSMSDLHLDFEWKKICTKDLKLLSPN